MNKKEITLKFKKFEKEYKTLNSRITREFGEEYVFEGQYNEFKNEFLDEIIKDDGDWYLLDQNMDIIILNMYTYICEKRLEILRKSHSIFWFKFIDDSNFKLKYLEISNKLDEITPKDAISVKDNQLDDIRNLESKDLKELAIISEQSKKSKKNSMYFVLGTGIFFSIFGAVISNLDRFAIFFGDFPASWLFVLLGGIAPFIIGFISMFIYARFFRGIKLR